MRSWTVGVAVVAAGLALVGAAAGGRGADVPRVVIDSASAGAFSVVVGWTVDRPARVVVEYGDGQETPIWSKETVMTTAGAGTTRLSTLEPATTYVFRVVAVSGAARNEAQGGVRTQLMPTAVRGRTIPNALVVNGQRFFPRMVFKQCPYAYDTSLSAGINVFMGTDCTTISGQLSRLAGRASR